MGSRLILSGRKAGQDFSPGLQRGMLPGHAIGFRSDCPTSPDRGNVPQSIAIVRVHSPLHVDHTTTLAWLLSRRTIATQSATNRMS